MNKTFFFVLVTMAGSGLCATAQFADSLTLQVGAIGTAASKNYQPHWMVSNRFDALSNQQNDVAAFVTAHNIHRFAGSKTGRDSLLKPWYVQYGAALYGNRQFDNVFAQEAFVKAGYKNWQFRVGRLMETTGAPDLHTSLGSLGISGNALPIPKIGFAVTDYTPVPFTKDFLQFKGQVAHGWFGNNRYMKDAFYHEKIFYLRMGKKKLKLYGGVQHFAEWGGRRGNVQLERSMKGFLDVLLVRQADDGSVNTPVTGLPPNRPGDQRGLLELGIQWENDKIVLNAYHQTPFETGRDVDPRNIDRLMGLHIAPRSGKGFFRSITAEFLYTFDMLGFVPEFDRQSYYNNGAYKTGWEYEGRVIGTPMFTNRLTAAQYFPASYQPVNWDAPDNTIPGNDNIVNNRVVALHLGAVYSFSTQLEGKTMVTYSANYGTHNQGTPFYPNKKQLYSLQQFQYTLPKAGLAITAAIAVDAGQMTDNAGLLLGVKKSFSGFVKKK